MVKVNFNTSDFQRQVADAGALILKNRFFEKTPFLTDDGASLIARPGMRRLTYIGDGPIRGLASEAGSFNGDLFVVSGDTLYRMDNLLNQTSLQSGLFDPERGFVNMAITARIDAVPEYLFVADGRNLFVYDGSTTTAVAMPDDVGVIDVAVIASYVIVIPVQEDGYQGRFYWIEPGETTVDPLNFATAERSPDGVYGVQVFGDQFWLPGESTTEVWYVAGANPSDPTAPVMQPLRGVVFDRGSWQNTAKAIHETMIVVDADGGVFRIQGGSPQRVSTPDIEEQIRKAMAVQSNSII